MYGEERDKETNFEVEYPAKL